MKKAKRTVKPSQSSPATVPSKNRVVEIDIKLIRANGSQPRQDFDTESLIKLADSIRRYGILQPLSVRKISLCGGHCYELVAGERRLRAGILAGLTEVPCILMTMDDQESALVALVENLQRQDLDFIEEAQGIMRLLEQFSLSQEQAAQVLGKSQSGIANKLRLLRHSQKVLDAIRENGLTERHARALLKLPGEGEKLRAISVIASCNMSVARTERYVEQLLEQNPEPTKKANLGAFFNHLNQSLAKIQLSGIPAVSERRETDSVIVYTITIPK